MRGIRILCDYLTIRGHLEKEGNEYRLTPSTAMFLDRSSPSWMGSIVEYLAAPEMMDFFLDDPTSYRLQGYRLTPSFRTSAPTPAVKPMAKAPQNVTRIAPTAHARAARACSQCA